VVRAGVVELADTPALGAGAARRGGSSPSARTSLGPLPDCLAMATDERTADELIPHQPYCMGCGPENPATLGLRLRREGARIHGEATLGRIHEGAPGYAHGGAVATLLDDAFGFVAMGSGHPAVTARLEVDYRAPVLIGQPLVIETWDESERPEDRKRHLRGELRDAGGKVLAEASALFVRVDPSHFHNAAGRMPDHWGEVPW
jgi:acyl-CoA thioesterase FadM